MSRSVPHTLYITLQYLRTDPNGEHKYHWGLYATGDNPPNGTLFHASDAGRRALDLFYEQRTVRNPLRSVSMTACLRIGNAPSSAAIDRCLSTVPLMNRRRIPAGEPRWTCRVFVKEALNALQIAGILNLPASVGSVERACLLAANHYLPFHQQTQRAGLYNDLGWLTSGSRTTPMEVDPFYPTQMEVDSSGRRSSTRSYGSLMDIDSSGRHSSPRSYGSLMETDPYTGRSLARY